MNIEASRIFRINSGSRLSGTDTSFAFQLVKSPDEVYDYVVCLHAEIPVTYYVVRAGLNTFILQEGATQATVTVPPGNYNSQSFQSVLIPLINAASPNHWTYSMTIPSQFTGTSTGKYTYTVTGNSSQPSFVMNSSLAVQMGFLASTTNTFSGNSLVSTAVVNFLPVNVIIHSDIVDDQEDILQEVYRGNTNLLSNLEYKLTTSPEAYAKRLRNNNTNVYNFYITDIHGVVLDLNGHDCHFTLLLYRNYKTNDLIKNYVKMRVLQSGTENLGFPV